MWKKNLYSNIPLLIMLASCQAFTANPDIPALIVNPGEDSRAALKATLAGLFGGYETRLSDDALTRSSLLILEPGLHKKPGDPPATGRVVSQPYKFRLIKNGGDCILIDLRDRRRYVLADTSCVAE